MCGIELVSKSLQQVISWVILTRDFINTIRTDKIKELNKLLKIECSKFISRVFYKKRDSDWAHRDHLQLIKEGYNELTKTISVSLVNAYPCT